jgi:hypothetical protein
MKYSLFVKIDFILPLSPTLLILYSWPLILLYVSKVNKYRKMDSKAPQSDGLLDNWVCHKGDMFLMTWTSRVNSNLWMLEFKAQTDSLVF